MSNTEKLPRGIRKVQPTGRYQVRYTGPDGKRYSGGTFRRKTDAERALGRIHAAIESGVWKPLAQAHESGIDPRTVTLRQLSENWIEIRVNRDGKPLAPKTVQEYRRLIDSSLSRFADKPVREISRAQVEAWWKSPELGTGRGRNASYKYLKSLLDWAEKQRLIMESPCQIERATVYRSREQNTPTEAEVAIILDSAPSDEVRAALALIAYAGLRPGEALALRRKDLSTIERGDDTWRVVNVSRSLSWLTGGRIEIKDTKSAEGARSLALPKIAEELLSKHLETVSKSPEALIFSRDRDGKVPWPHQALHRRFQGPREVAGYEGTLYSLRHYHLTSYAMTGATLKQIMQRGGHSSIEAAMRYQRAAGRDLELVERLG